MCPSNNPQNARDGLVHQISEFKTLQMLVFATDSGCTWKTLAPEMEPATGFHTCSKGWANLNYEDQTQIKLYVVSHAHNLSMKYCLRCNYNFSSCIHTILYVIWYENCLQQCTHTVLLPRGGCHGLNKWQQINKDNNSQDNSLIKTTNQTNNTAKKKSLGFRRSSYTPSDKQDKTIRSRVMVGYSSEQRISSTLIRRTTLYIYI